MYRYQKKDCFNSKIIWKIKGKSIEWDTSMYMFEVIKSEYVDET